jgi:RNA binding exosome subunit
MNIITIHAVDDLQTILEDSFYISDKLVELNKEVPHNMWCITISDDIVLHVSATDFLNFFDALLQKMLRQLQGAGLDTKATFYVWFDKQALQLRFNVISGHAKELSFGCDVRIVASPQDILEDFIKIAQEVACNGDQVEILDPDGDWDDENEEPFVLDVYVAQLRGKSCY